MPNRIIAEGICTSETIDTLAPLEEVAFYRLLVRCDDFGRFYAHPDLVRAACFPLRTSAVNCRQMSVILDKLAKVGLIVIYAHSGRSYLQVVNWDRFQRRRAKVSKFPGLDSKLLSDDGEARANAAVFVNVFDNEYDKTSDNMLTSKTEKESFGEEKTVQLTTEEHAKLAARFGKDGTAERIQNLENYLLAKGKKYRSHYRTILMWANREGETRAGPATLTARQITEQDAAEEAERRRVAMQQMRTASTPEGVGKGLDAIKRKADRWRQNHAKNGNGV